MIKWKIGGVIRCIVPIYIRLVGGVLKLIAWSNDTYKHGVELFDICDIEQFQNFQKATPRDETIYAIQLEAEARLYAHSMPCIPIQDVLVCLQSDEGEDYWGFESYKEALFFLGFDEIEVCINGKMGSLSFPSVRHQDEVAD